MAVAAAGEKHADERLVVRRRGLRQRVHPAKDRKERRVADPTEQLATGDVMLDMVRVSVLSLVNAVAAQY